MTSTAMHPSEAVAPHSARGQKSSLLNQAVAASVHGGFPLMSPAPIQATVVEDDALTSGAHIHSSSSQANTSAALSVHLAISAATAALAHSLCVYSRSMHALSQGPNRGVKRGRQVARVGRNPGWPVGRLTRSEAMNEELQHKLTEILSAIQSATKVPKWLLDQIEKKEVSHA